LNGHNLTSKNKLADAEQENQNEKQKASTKTGQNIQKLAISNSR